MTAQRVCAFGGSGLVELERWGEEIDKLRAIRLGDFGHGGGVLLEVLVVLLRIGEIQVDVTLRRDGRDEHDARCALAAVVLLRGVLEEFLQLLLELGQTIIAGKGFVEAVKRKRLGRSGTPRRPRVSAHVIRTHAGLKPGSRRSSAIFSLCQ